MSEAGWVACIAYVYQKGQLMGILHMEHPLVVIQERHSPPLTWSWQLKGEYIGRTIPPDLSSLRLAIVTPKGKCEGDGFWTEMPGIRPHLVRGPAWIMGNGKLTGPREALYYLGFPRPEKKGGKK